VLQRKCHKTVTMVLRHLACNVLLRYVHIVPFAACVLPFGMISDAMALRNAWTVARAETEPSWFFFLYTNGTVLKCTGRKHIYLTP